jgi:glucose/arabinose dehydrogenase
MLIPGATYRQYLAALIGAHGLLVCALLLMAAPARAGHLPIDQIRLPDGFEIAIFADSVPNARQLSISPAGTVFAGSRREGKVYAIIDKNRDWQADEVFVVASGLNMPTGTAFRDGALYVAATNRVLRFDNIESRLDDPPPPVVLVDNLPSVRQHGWRHMKFGADGRLYIPIGIPCNACEAPAPFGEILSFDADGQNRAAYVSGIRSVQGLDWHPVTGEMWFSDNGRDMMGDDVPPDEINRVSIRGENFGAPWCHGGTIPDPDLPGAACDGFTPPMALLPAHVAPLGIAFYDGDQFPEAYRGRLFVMEHGSWNRSTPIGYRITMLDFDSSGAPNYQVFAEGWLGEDGNSWGRPADILVAPDGSLLIADDGAGVIYRISYTGAR